MSAGVEREIESLRTELAQEIERRSRIREAQMRAYDTGEATRRRTTTRNANADWCNERIESLRTQIRALETQIGASRAQGGGERTIYDQRSAIARQVEVAAPQLYSALQNLLDAVMERDVQQSIESVVLSDAESALAAARVGGAS